MIQEGNDDLAAYMPNDESQSHDSASTNPTPEEQTSALSQPNETVSPGFVQRDQTELLWVAEKVNRVREEMRKYVIGQSEMIELLLAGIFSNGHILLEGVPGVAKTLSSKALSRVLHVDFSRIQFTPDLMPSDVIGTSVFSMKDSEFNFKKGPIFSNIVLIDEINRAPAKTQAALFEVMEERQITYDGTQYQMSFPFLVIATQNPVEQEGTYNLPEAQLDRFLFKIKLDYPTLDEETLILTRYKEQIQAPDLANITAVFTADELHKVQKVVEKVIIEDRLIQYIAQIVNKTRNHSKLYLGGSPRASLSILKAAKAFAAIRGRDFVTPDDIQFVTIHVLNHRLILTPEAEMEGTHMEEVIREIVQTIEVPR
ncbi:AAA family ATPase [Fluviicola chungangensis]|uniref:MoxR family ATPase n=1 Tax=Fluviicola chungangensis TaxID=2597671 RepID=A0A556N3L0_9FLAO|nr:MoxR family ATPase [Fluviicola chungangensis]TSJ46649.1 MoxR family ATPase [Fluviicola chungangensis]